MRPGPAVLASFGASADPVSLPGGEGTAWRAGQAVLKPAGDPRVARWTADLYRDLDTVTARPDLGFRVPRPLRTSAGDWVAQDPLGGAWVAWQWLRGEPASWAGVSLAGPGRQPVDDRGPGRVGRARPGDRPGGGARAAGRAAAEPAGGAPAGAPARPADPRRPRRERALRCGRAARGDRLLALLAAGRAGSGRRRGGRADVERRRPGHPRRVGRRARARPAPGPCARLPSRHRDRLPARRPGWPRHGRAHRPAGDQPDLVPPGLMAGFPCAGHGESQAP